VIATAVGVFDLKILSGRIMGSAIVPLLACACAGAMLLDMIGALACRALTLRLMEEPGHIALVVRVRLSTTPLNYGRLELQLAWISHQR
jgi:hypothetical protein